MDFGAYMIGMVKTNTKGLCKDNIKNMRKDWLRGSYFVLERKSTVTEDRLLIANFHKYNVRKVLSFIAIEDTGRKKDGIPYSSKYPDLLDNVDICLVDCPICMSKFFEYVN